MSGESLSIDCDEHGKSTAAVVCGHLIRNTNAPLGFIENSSIEGDLQGWCYACEYMFLVEQDKTEAFVKFTQLSTVCEQCYSNIKLHHEIHST